MNVGQSVYDSVPFRHIPEKGKYPIVAVPLTKRATVAERKERESLPPGQRKKEREDTIFSAFPEHYKKDFHKAVARLRFFNREDRHEYKNLYEPNANGKYFVVNGEDGQR